MCAARFDLTVSSLLRHVLPINTYIGPLHAPKSHASVSQRVLVPVDDEYDPAAHAAQTEAPAAREHEQATEQALPLTGVYEIHSTSDTEPLCACLALEFPDTPDEV
jgi:hypothetical protein